MLMFMCLDEWSNLYITFLMSTQTIHDPDAHYPCR
jgi:hypothetical protein